MLSGSVCSCAGVGADARTGFDRHFHFHAGIDRRGCSSRRAHKGFAARGDRIAEVLANGDQRVGRIDRGLAPNADVLDEFGQMQFERVLERHEVRPGCSLNFEFHGGRRALRFCLNLRAAA